MRVLLVEDEPGIAQFIRQGLNEAGYAVDVALDGREGLDYALATEYDILVLDILLPKMDGYHLLKELRNQRIRTPVLLLTAMDGVEDRVRGLDAGADDYLVKPFAFSELLARLLYLATPTGFTGRHSHASGRLRDGHSSTGGASCLRCNRTEPAGVCAAGIFDAPS